MGIMKLIKYYYINSIIIGTIFGLFVISDRDIEQAIVMAGLAGGFWPILWFVIIVQLLSVEWGSPDVVPLTFIDILGITIILIAPFLLIPLVFRKEETGEQTVKYIHKQQNQTLPFRDDLQTEVYDQEYQALIQISEEMGIQLSKWANEQVNGYNSQLQEAVTSRVIISEGHVIVLNLNDMELKEIPKSAILEEFSFLKAIKLSNLQIKKIDLKVFRLMIKLEIINLEGNQLVSIDLQPLKNRHKLNTINLQGNNLTEENIQWIGHFRVKGVNVIF